MRPNQTRRTRIPAARRSIISSRARPLHVVGAAILDGPRCLVAQRGPAMSEAGRWEFPGGKIEPREAPQAALAREIREELGIAIAVGPWLGRGEAVVGGREIVLDVFAATRLGGVPSPSEHAALRWIGADAIDGLDWPEADRPILPFLRRVLGFGPVARPLTRPVPIVSVDWAARAAGRAVYTAQPCASGWRIERAAPPRDGWRLEQVLATAERVGAAFGGASLIAIDAALGVPHGYGIRSGTDDFPALIEAWAADGALERAALAPEDWSMQAPFFRVARGKGSLTRFIERAGGRAALYRQVERANAAKPVFATAGIPGTVGSGSIALWRELLALRSAGGRAFRLWPFEVEIEDVAAAGCPVLAESYPRACYGVALAETLPARPLPLPKSNGSERVRRPDEPSTRSGCERASANPIPRADLEAAALAEDDFDALFQVVALARLVDAGLPLATHLVDPVWEGGIVGTGGLAPWAPGGRRRRRAR